MTRVSAVDKLYPEIKAGGFSRFDHKVGFFSRVNSLVSENDVVLDFGAGRGQWGDVQTSYAFKLQNLRGRVKKIIGIDVDDAVMNNPFTDENHIIVSGQPLPLADESIDFIISYAVLEHVEDPEFMAAELSRVLKPGGWICAWTPNKYGYVASVARLVPNRLHAKVLRKLGLIGGNGQRAEHDVFPTVYKMNSVGMIGRLFPAFENYSYVYSGPEGYAGRYMLLAWALRLYNWLLPNSCGSHLYVFLKKN